MTTYYQELFSTGRMNLHVEYHAQGGLKSVYFTPTRSLPVQLYNSIRLPEVHVTQNEIWQWIARAQESSNITYHAG